MILYVCIFCSNVLESRASDNKQETIDTSMDLLQRQLIVNIILQRGSRFVNVTSLIEPGTDLFVDCEAKLFMLVKQNPGARGTGKVVLLLVSMKMIAGNIGRSAGFS